jgi:hypothetical protein
MSEGFVAAKGLVGEQLLHPLELGESVGGEEPCLQLDACVLWRRAAHQIPKAAHRSLRQGSQDVVELHGVMCDALEDELYLHHREPGFGFEAQKAGILK